jgi:hypothetical protein
MIGTDVLAWMLAGLAKQWLLPLVLLIAGVIFVAVMP